ncbi:hypothetical protein LCGC14_2782700 [marine sediment metagenome]|uniref:Uncharacterized protein n=1 Tax=marine sediment metagenome TaxID=412755 RepID=A0A0F8YSU4_9ZZZZ
MNGHTQDVLDYLGAPIPDEEEWLSYECKLNRRTKTAPQIRPKEWCGGLHREDRRLVHGTALSWSVPSSRRRDCAPGLGACQRGLGGTPNPGGDVHYSLGRCLGHDDRHEGKRQ